MLTSLAKRLFLQSLEGVIAGSVRVECRDRTYEFGQATDLAASLVVHDDRFFLRAVTGTDIGIGESYMDGEWSTPDLVALGRLVVRNRHVLDRQRRTSGRLSTIAGALARRLRDNSLAGSRRHIQRHYDLGNDFFQLFLDSSLRMYSCGYFMSPADSLESAQTAKVERICRKLDLSPSDHVLEIGSGWGGFAAFAAERYGCRVTTTTISEEQYRYVREWQASAGDVGQRVHALKADYRELRGTFDKVVSIEMFEAVGLAHYDEYFGAVDRLLAPGGAVLLQTITVDDQWFPHYHGQPDWIEKHIFPGGELASVGEILKSLGRVTALSLYHAENFGTHYARTLNEWRARFMARLHDVRAQGFDAQFIRMWEFYLAICEAAFLERHTGVFQLMLVKSGVSGGRFNEPWRDSMAAQFGVPRLDAPGGAAGASAP